MNERVADAMREGLRALTEAQIAVMSEIAIVSMAGKKLEIMRISGEEERKIGEMLEVFQEYIDDHPFFDIIRSRKFGYIRIDSDGLHEQYATAEGILRHCIIAEMHHDIGTHGNPVLDFDSEEERALRERLAPYLAKLRDPGQGYRSLDSYVAMWRQGRTVGAQTPASGEASGGL